MRNPILVGFAKRGGLDLKLKHFANIYGQKYSGELKLREVADKSCKNRRFSAPRGMGAICIHSYSKRVIHESARISNESRSVSPRSRPPYSRAPGIRQRSAER